MYWYGKNIFDQWQMIDAFTASQYACGHPTGYTAICLAKPAVYHSISAGFTLGHGKAYGGVVRGIWFTIDGKPATEDAVNDAMKIME